jgi:hypothetical protein
MRRDEAGTARRIREMHSSVWDVQLVKYGGRLVNTAGDSLLAVFATVRGAVDCALELQRCLRELNNDVDAAARMEMRIGVNLGDVIIDGQDVRGEGVEVAARLQALADPGGICVSRPVWDAIAGRIDARFLADGIHAPTKIARPVEVFRWHPAPDSIDTTAQTPDPARMTMLLEATDAQGRVHRLGVDLAVMKTQREGLVIGRQASGSDLTVLHPSVSRRHARLTLDGTVVMIEDLGSTNGTVVDGVRLQPHASAPLILGRTLKLGDLMFEIRTVPG